MEKPQPSKAQRFQGKSFTEKEIFFFLVFPDIIKLIQTITKN